MLTKTSPAKRFVGANGSIALSFGFAAAYQTFVIHGGPYAKFPKNDLNAFGVCLREVEPEVYDVWLPIQDFSVPDNDDDVRSAMREVFRAALANADVYIGCMGGFGRTGLFLALLAKVAGKVDPVGFVRANYTSHAVETPEQQAYVRDFDVSSIRSWLFWASWSRWWGKLFFGRPTRKST